MNGRIQIWSCHGWWWVLPQQTATLLLSITWFLLWAKCRQHTGRNVGSKSQTIFNFALFCSNHSLSMCFTLPDTEMAALTMTIWLFPDRWAFHSFKLHEKRQQNGNSGVVVTNICLFIQEVVVFHKTLYNLKLFLTPYGIVILCYEGEWQTSAVICPKVSVMSWLVIVYVKIHYISHPSR